METEDESTSYLKYLNDTENPNNYLLTTNGAPLLNDSFSVEPIFTEIETGDWPSEGFPVLLSSPLITEDCSETQSVENHIDLFKEKNGITTANYIRNEEEMDIENLEPDFLHFSSEKDKDNIQETNKDSETYINYAPIVKENANGNKEIYLTEKDINNDGSIIQLLNTDGSIITIDKSILSSLNLPPKETQNIMLEKTFFNFCTTITAIKCKLCMFLCETVDNFKKHLSEKHPENFALDHKPQFVNGHQNGAVSILNKNKLKCNVNGELKKEYTVFVCSICKDVCSDKEELKQHMITNHKLINKDPSEQKSTNEKATEGKKSLKTLSAFLIKKQQKALKKVQCTIPGCNLSFSKDEIREKHEQCHVGDNKKQFKCSECDEKFSIWRICSNHLWKAHKIDMGLIVCPMCNDFKSNSPGRVLNHMAIHDEEKPFLCALCGKGFKQMPQLKNHEAIHKPVEEMPKWSTIKQCDVCDRYFANSKSLKKHIQSVHENFKPFICNICGHKTSRKAMLELHLRQHTGAKPHKCIYCDYRTGDHNCLRKHTMKHVGAHKYTCPHCTYTCIQSASLKRHIVNRHPGKSGTYNCKYCSYTTINAAAHSAHEKCHENNSKENGTLQETATNNFTPENYLQDDVEDDETQNCFLSTDQSEETVDTGGITIPAGFETQLVS